jgi:hypothetical protein
MFRAHEQVLVFQEAATQLRAVGRASFIESATASFLTFPCSSFIPVLLPGLIFLHYRIQYSIPESPLFFSSSSSLILTRLSGPRFIPTTSHKIC